MIGYQSYDVQLITTIAVALANIFLVVLTSIYVLLTRRMLLEMKSARGPSVYFDLELPGTEMRMAIRNTGQSAARNVHFTVDDKIPWRQFPNMKVGINALEVIRNGISYLPAGQTLKYIAGFPQWDKVQEGNAVVKVGISFEDEFGKTFRREYLIDVNQYRSVLFESFRDPNRDVAQAILDAENRRQSHESSKQFPSRVAYRPTKKCPFCGESIPSTAKKCSHCLEFIIDQKDDDTGANAD